MGRARALLALAGVLGSLGGSVAQAMVADLVAAGAARGGVCVGARGGEPRRHVGPPIGGLFLVIGSWSALFPGVAALSALSPG